MEDEDRKFVEIAEQIQRGEAYVRRLSVEYQADPRVYVGQHGDNFRTLNRVPYVHMRFDVVSTQGYSRPPELPKAALMRAARRFLRETKGIPSVSHEEVCENMMLWFAEQARQG